MTTNILVDRFRAVESEVVEIPYLCVFAFHRITLLPQARFEVVSGSPSATADTPPSIHNHEGHRSPFPAISLGDSSAAALRRGILAVVTERDLRERGSRQKNCQLFDVVVLLLPAGKRRRGGVATRLP